MARDLRARHPRDARAGRALRYGPRYGPGRNLRRRAGALALGVACCGLLVWGALAAQRDASGAAPQYRWKYVLAVPLNYPGFGTGAARLAENIERMSAGRIAIRLYGAGELVAPFEVFDAVARGTAELGQGAAYFWKGRLPAAQPLTTVPFGLTCQEMFGWVYHGGGLALWQELYAPHGVVPLPAGCTGVQMGGWFNREINSLADLRRLKIRMPGLGGEVLARAGATVVNVPGPEIFPALQAGTIDATDWIGPWNDLAFGLHKAAKYYYYPGWHEPGAVIELLVNAEAMASLPPDLQAVVRGAAQAAAVDVLAEYTAHSQRALESLLHEHGTELRRFPPAVIERFRALAEDALRDLADSDPAAARILDSQRVYQRRTAAWTALAEGALLKARPVTAAP